MSLQTIHRRRKKHVEIGAKIGERNDTCQTKQTEAMDIGYSASKMLR